MLISRYLNRWYLDTKKFVITNNLYLVFGLGLIASLIGAYFIYSLIKEFTTPNYHFYGTHYDFIAFYSGAISVLHHNIGQVYDTVKMINLQRQIIPHPIGATGYMPFLDPPFVAVLLSPLALFGINTARLIWLFLSSIISVFSIRQLTKTLGLRNKYIATVLLLLTFPMFQTIIEGQVSILVLLGGCLSYRFFKQHKKVLSGASLVLLWVIPQFGVFALIGLLVRREWEMLKGWGIAMVVLLAVTLPITGINIYFTYIKLLTSVTGDHFKAINTSAQLAWRGALNYSSGLNGFFSALIGPEHTGVINMLFFMSILALLGFLYKALPKREQKYNPKQNALLLLAALMAALLIDPHVFGQDVIVIYLILPALFVIFKTKKLLAVVLFSLVCDLVYFDQFWRIHIFAIAGLITICCSLSVLFKIKKIVQAKT